MDRRRVTSGEEEEKDGGATCDQYGTSDFEREEVDIYALQSAQEFQITLQNKILRDKVQILETAMEDLDRKNSVLKEVSHCDISSLDLDILYIFIYIKKTSMNISPSYFREDSN